MKYFLMLAALIVVGCRPQMPIFSGTGDAICYDVNTGKKVVTVKGDISIINVKEVDKKYVITRADGGKVTIEANCTVMMGSYAYR